MIERRGFSVAPFLAAAITMTACSGGTSSLSNGLPATTSANVRPDRPPEVLYVSDALANVVNVFDAAKPYVSEGSITTGIAGPAGVALDGRSLLVANTDDVVEYDSGATSPSFTYTDGLRYPKSVLAGGNGLIYVADFSKKQITVFPRGTNKIEATIPLPGKPVALTMGGGANMYITTVGPDGTNVFELPPGSTTPKNLQLRFGHQIAAVVEGIAVDKSKRMCPRLQTSERKGLNRLIG